jgi:hypothetical protein
MAFKKATFLLAMPLVSALAFAQEPPPRPEPAPPQETNPPGQQPPAQQPPAPQQPSPSPEPETTGTKEVPAEVVSADAQAKTITVKVLVKKDAASEATEQQGTIPVDAEASTALEGVTPGEKVKLVCRMSGNKVIAVKAITKGDQPKTDAPKS